MSLQQRIVQEGQKIAVSRKTGLTREQLETYERVVVSSIPGLPGAATVARVDTVRNGIIIGFVVSDTTNLHEVVLHLQGRHRAIIDEIRVMKGEDASVYIRFKSLPPFCTSSNVWPVVVCWVLVGALLGCKLVLGGALVPSWMA